MTGAGRVLRKETQRGRGIGEAKAQVGVECRGRVVQSPPTGRTAAQSPAGRHRPRGGLTMEARGRDDDKPFLSRWSQRKRQAVEEDAAAAAQADRKSTRLNSSH